MTQALYAHMNNKTIKIKKKKKKRKFTLKPTNPKTKDRCYIAFV
jgi:hypothetical protein